MSADRDRLHTTDDLRAALREIADAAPELGDEPAVDDLDAARRRRAARRTWLAVAASLLLVAGLVGGVGLVQRQRATTAATTPTTTPTTAPVATLEGHRWRLATARVGDVEPLAGAAELSARHLSAPELTLSGGRLVLVGAVNTTSLPVRVEGDRLVAAGPATTTEVGCLPEDEAACALDTRLTALVGASPAVSRRGDALVLAAGDTRAAFDLADAHPETDAETTVLLPGGDGSDPLGTPAALANRARYLGTTTLPAAGASATLRAPAWRTGRVSARLACPAGLPGTGRVDVARVRQVDQEVTWSCPADLATARTQEVTLGEGDADVVVTGLGPATGARASLYQDFSPLPTWRAPASWTPPWAARERTAGPDHLVTDVRPDAAAPDRPRTLRVRIPADGRLIVEQNAPGVLAVLVNGRMVDLGATSPDAPSLDGVSSLPAPQEQAPMSGSYDARRLGVQAEAVLGEEVEVTILPWRFSVPGWRVSVGS